MSEWKTLDCAWTSLYHYCLSKRMKDPGHLEGWREAELLSACPADSLPDQPILNHKWTANLGSRRAKRQFPFCPKSRCHLQRQGAAPRDFICRKSCWYHCFAGSSQGTASGVSHPVFSLSPEELWSSGLCAPLIWNNTDTVQELMYAKALTWMWNWKGARCMSMLLVISNGHSTE